MSFQTPLTIKQIVNDIHSKKYLLPSIQREFVWSAEQIKMLFDSLMRDYPINSFLFWKVPSEKTSEFIFYEFLREYHEKDSYHNPKANISGSNEVMAVLDGQQRLTSLYIALKGTYANKIPYKRWDNPQAYPRKKLYLNLLGVPEDSEYAYEFEFLTDDEVKKNDEDHHWFLVGEILNMKNLSEVMKYWSKNIVYGDVTSEQSEYANDTLSKLYEVIHVTPVISYYLEQSSELDKVLNIFIRVNSGGTTLSYSDLLLSIATAQWQNRDAREEITGFVDEINKIGRGFNIGKDIVLKASLVLCDLPNISFKVDNFKHSNMIKIEQEWESITKAIRDAVTLISSFGFSRENMTSNNLIIPIAYYLKTIGLPNNFDTSTSRIEDRKKIKLWFISSLLKRVFSFSPDGVLRPVRSVIQKNSDNGFPIKEIFDYFKGTNRDLQFTDDDIFNLLYTKYGQRNTIVILSLLYPWADLRQNFHIDHIYPKSEFTIKKLHARGIAESDMNYFLDNYNYIGNLQLLEEIQNLEKQAMDFDVWLNEKIPQNMLTDYKLKHFIPDVDLSFNNFYEFFAEREKLLVNKLKKELMI